MSVWLIGAAGGEVGWLTGVLLDYARGGAEWILWVLVILGLLSFVVYFERLLFYRRVAMDAEALRQTVMTHMGRRDVDAAMRELQGREGMEARVLAYGIREAERGPAAVQELCAGAIGIERLRYERGLNFLATVGSNAPFIGLFGTVMGVIMAFDQLRNMGGGGTGDPAANVMGAIAEALIATGVGLLVAIPAIIFFNLHKARVKKIATSTQLLVQTMVALLHDPRSDASRGAPSGEAR